MSKHLKPVFLLGMMGSGKTTYGKKLANRLQRTWIDLDQAIESDTGLSIPSLFQRGEEHFRFEETRVLREIVSKSGLVISCGGGTPCFHGNIEWMNNQGTTIYLQMPPKAIWSRMKSNAGDRPLLAGLTEEQQLEKLEQLHTAREPFYAQAKHIVSGLSVSVKLLEDVLVYDNQA